MKAVMKGYLLEAGERYDTHGEDSDDRWGGRSAGTRGSSSSKSPLAQPTAPGAASTNTSPTYIAAGHCPLTIVAASAKPPAALHYSPPPPVPDVRDWYGNSTLWVMLGPDSQLPSQPNPDGSLGTKFPWFRLANVNVKVTAERLDGPTGRFSADVGTVAGYGASGFVPSELSWSAPVVGGSPGKSLNNIPWFSLCTLHRR